ncbi:uncharacterized protein MAM_03542 [Metarhizium album ARSEF 1941]|uniref:Uncharacterized protein n=1 Tax=Metarhizium album (strain ARSEF 1941) TaxID=1081103 RepID=A0A0B2WWH5_METAS|nr:uncharacterized protein MAM_03542 [Metarhizium album ARSEF 1941]KHN98418.1 hypothetical protein MAM_03542 [Metarhizium album ARSEF 1941]
MVVGLLTITAIPTITGVAEAVSAQKRQNAASKEQEKINLAAEFDGTRPPSEGLLACFLKDGKIVLQFPGQNVRGHKFCGFHFKYPREERLLGLVSSIQDEPPMLNWIYVNRETRALQYGALKDTLGHIVGPWGWSEDERFLTLNGAIGGFTARKRELDGVERWILYWEPDEPDEQQGRSGSVRLHRKPVFGVESSYVRDGQD